MCLAPGLRKEPAGRRTRRVNVRAAPSLPDGEDEMAAASPVGLFAKPFHRVAREVSNLRLVRARSRKRAKAIRGVRIA